MDKRKHIVITGTGRTGTTFLVQLFGFLGFDVGFPLSELQVNEKRKCGLEHGLMSKDCPHVIKDPKFCSYANRILESDDIEIEYIIVPIRNLFAAAESRRFVQGDSEDYPIPGGLWGTKEAHAQERVLANELYGLLENVSKIYVPIVFINFPMLIDNSSYLYNKLKPIVGHIPFMTFKVIFYTLVRPHWVHEFKE